MSSNIDRETFVFSMGRNAAGTATSRIPTEGRVLVAGLRGPGGPARGGRARCARSCLGCAERRRAGCVR